MSENSDKYNKLDFEIRKITGLVITEMRINQLETEKNRLKRRYKQSIKECNDHIKNLRSDLRENANA